MTVYLETEACYPAFVDKSEMMLVAYCQTRYYHETTCASGAAGTEPSSSRYNRPLKVYYEGTADRLKLSRNVLIETVVSHGWQNVPGVSERRSYAY